LALFSEIIIKVNILTSTFTAAQGGQYLAPAAPQRVMVGLSGGVDSAVAAHLLLEQGLQVEALFMKNWEEDDRAGYCAAAEDLADAQAVADRLGIRLHTVNFSSEYWERVFENFLQEYKALRTPNPDVLCNREIKFSAFLDHALALGADAMATGHYARITHDASGFHLRLAADAAKDQTYFLHLLNQAQLGRALFPLAALTKPEVRALARQLGLQPAAKKDSTGICFIGERRFREFLAAYLPTTPGPIETPEGLPLGEHQGLAFYTLGQRQGLGVGGVAGREGAWYVAAKDAARNALILVQNHDHPLLVTSALVTGSVHWIGGAPALPFSCRARVRHRQPLQACVVEAVEGRFRAQFSCPQRAVTPGQSVVFYFRDECLGGGVIEKIVD
jgi:tRNA-uridine 2-sulfurtransferase